MRRTEIEVVQFQKMIAQISLWGRNDEDRIVKTIWLWSLMGEELMRTGDGWWLSNPRRNGSDLLREKI